MQPPTNQTTTQQFTAPPLRILPSSSNKLSKVSASSNYALLRNSTSSLETTLKYAMLVSMASLPNYVASHLVSQQPQQLASYITCQMMMSR